MKQRNSIFKPTNTRINSGHLPSTRVLALVRWNPLISVLGTSRGCSISSTLSARRTSTNSSEMARLPAVRSANKRTSIVPLRFLRIQTSPYRKGTNDPPFQPACCRGNQQSVLCPWPRSSGRSKTDQCHPGTSYPPSRCAQASGSHPTNGSFQPQRSSVSNLGDVRRQPFDGLGKLFGRNGRVDTHLELRVRERRPFEDEGRKVMAKARHLGQRNRVRQLEKSEPRWINTNTRIDSEG